MTNINFTFTPRAATISVGTSLTVEGKLHVCLMQLGAANDAIATDQGRPAAVAAVRHLLVGGDGHSAAVLSEMLPGAQPVLIVLPEFAFGSSDWEMLDTLIRQANRPVVLVAGFGATNGQILLDWRAARVAEGETRRHFAWDQTACAIGGVRPVNGGWCWIHVPREGTHCLIYLKNIAEQNVEAVALADLQFGHAITHLSFNDVDLFPLVCADMLQPMAQHPDSAQARIHDILNGLGDATRPALVIGSLLQHGYNVNWERAIDSVLNQVMANRPGLVVLCNISHDRPVASETEDRWRSLTGVYGKWDELTKGQKNLPCGRRLNAPGIVGAVLRRSEPTIASGTVDWGPYGPVDGKFVWHANMLCPAGAAGLQAPISRPPEQHGYEMARFLRRHRPPEEGWSPRVVQGADRLTSHIASAAKPSAAKILDALIGGVRPALSNPDALHDDPIQPAAITGLHALATLVTAAGIGWQSDEGQVGQLRLSANDRNILIWRDPIRTSRQMRSELGAWRLEATPHPDLIVLAASRFGDVEEGSVEEQRRDDVSSAPPPSADLGAAGTLAAAETDITLPQARRNVASLGLSRIASVYLDYDAAAGDGRRIDELLALINAFFPNEEAA
ncbi:MAG: hypothetical protein CVV14_14420 [Gammaproteobacteria bacterium HGW-Gammaproteobacteria-4]|nr:MAG: hypothetical protein CVV14_14420 [Gammaproteobacteria bacterium HGW-Gammaproteobacteria-4]PKQ36494.1 MAG: hypothetical protein CVT59_12025 [Actinobacteria bacterium HGW-Actinobacteria-1]